MMTFSSFFMQLVEGEKFSIVGFLYVEPYALQGVRRVVHRPGISDLPTMRLRQGTY